MNTDYKVKVVAFDQDGSETEVNFSFKTNVDEFYPKIVDVKLFIYRYSANIYIDLMASENFQQSWPITTDVYLNEELLYEDLKPVLTYQDFIGDVFFHSIDLENLKENTTYNVKLVVKGKNNNTVEKKFTTNSTNFEGNLNFKYQNEIDEFSKNQFENIIGNIVISLPEVTCHPMNAYNECNYNITDLSGLNSISSIDGDLKFLGAYDGLYGPGNIVPGLENLLNITGSITIIGANPTLLINKIISIDGDLYIERCYSNNFTNLNFLSNLNSLKGNLTISHTYLNDFCSLQQSLSNGFNGDYAIDQNAYNPAYQDIVNGSCKE
jgi:hypothetical protein